MGMAGYGDSLWPHDEAFKSLIAALTLSFFFLVLGRRYREKRERVRVCEGEKGRQPFWSIVFDFQVF
jgi:hypothetical protein